MKTVLINIPFRDAHTDELYEAGKTYPMSEDRIAEVKEVNPNFITVVAGAAADSKKGKKAKAAKTEESEGVEDVDIEEVAE